MGKFPVKRRLSPEERRALELLASNPNGATEELLVHGQELYSPHADRPRRRWTYDGTTPEHQGPRCQDIRGRSHDDHGCWPEGARRLIELGPGTRRCGRRWIPA